AAGAGCSVGIRFRPQAAGTRVGGLVIRSNAAGSPQVVGLSGTGVQATQTPDGGSNDDAGGDSGGGSGGGDDATSGGGLSVSGGCTLAGSEAATDPTLPLLVLAGLVAAWRGRRGVGQSAIR
ncbi:MAG: JDVT-CTERM domain-containing protein, partial [Chromatiales bacterium]|nr:JDVT-CTERM domain-containing protein [Chromatiales bacterium]